MCAPDMRLYQLSFLMLHQMLAGMHAASLRAVADLVWALLSAQSLHAADLARSLPNLRTAGARQAMRRVRRIISRPWLSSQCLTPNLIRLALRLTPAGEVTLILDSTRCLCWEIFTLGIRFHGRVLPIAWAILPYPWPKGSFTPTVVGLLNRTLTHWPASRPVHFLADRGFPSLLLFQTLDHWRQRLILGYTIRLRAGDWVRLADGQIVKVADLLSQATIGFWRSWLASYDCRRKIAPPALLVVGRGLPVYPAHQMGPADQLRRQERAKRRVAHLLSKGQPQAPQTDSGWALLSTAPDRWRAIGCYRGRFSTEGAYRDLKSWDLEAVASHQTDSVHLDGLIGLAALAYLLQAAIGAQAGRATEEEARARQKQWTTTDRLSVFSRGRLAFQDHAHDWRPWLYTILPQLTHRLSSKSVLADQANQPQKEAA